MNPFTDWLPAAPDPMLTAARDQADSARNAVYLGWATLAASGAAMLATLGALRETRRQAKSAADQTTIALAHLHADSSAAQRRAAHSAARVLSFLDQHFHLDRDWSANDPGYLLMREVERVMTVTLGSFPKANRIGALHDAGLALITSDLPGEVLREWVAIISAVREIVAFAPHCQQVWANSQVGVTGDTPLDYDLACSAIFEAEAECDLMRDRVTALAAPLDQLRRILAEVIADNATPAPSPTLAAAGR